VFWPMEKVCTRMPLQRVIVLSRKIDRLNHKPIKNDQAWSFFLPKDLRRKDAD